MELKWNKNVGKLLQWITKKSLIGLFSVTLITASSQVVTIPDSIAAKVIDDLIIKDHLVYKVNLQDSIIQVYQRKDSLQTEVIASYRLKETQYNLIVENTTKLLKMKEAELKDEKKYRRKLQFQNTLLKIGAVAEVVLIAIILI